MYFFWSCFVFSIWTTLFSMHSVIDASFSDCSGINALSNEGKPWFDQFECVSLFLLELAFDRNHKRILLPSLLLFWQQHHEIEQGQCQDDPFWSQKIDVFHLWTAILSSCFAKELVGGGQCLWLLCFAASSIMSASSWYAKRASGFCCFVPLAPMIPFGGSFLKRDVGSLSAESLGPVLSVEERSGRDSHAIETADVANMRAWLMSSPRHGDDWNNCCCGSIICSVKILNWWISFTKSDWISGNP